MKVNNINNSTNFNGVKLQTIKTPLKKFDIYSLDSRDKNFVNRLMNLMEHTTLPENTTTIGGRTPKQIALKALNKATSTSKNDYTSKVLISVENDKNITGIISAEEEGDMIVKGMAVWSNGVARKGLLHSMLSETKKLKDYSLIIPAENMAGSMKAFCRKLGFFRPKDYQSAYVVDAPEINKVIKNIEASHNFEVKQYKKHNFTNLEKKFFDTEA